MLCNSGYSIFALLFLNELLESQLLLLLIFVCRLKGKDQARSSMASSSVLSHSVWGYFSNLRLLCKFM